MVPDNEPHGERDFGAFEHNGHRIFWKIDYYNQSLTLGSEDPSDPRPGFAIMLASESKLACAGGSVERRIFRQDSTGDSFIETLGADLDRMLTPRWSMR
jgi:hypothetical protein